MPIQPLIVMGMHRSGTSLAAALLQDGGLDIGDRLMEGNWSNPRGHFEDMDFIEFQRGALVQLGLHQDGWETAELPALPADIVDRARALVEQKQQHGRPWGWKDPRTVLFLPLWLSLAPDATFAIVYRSPWEVIESLYRRGDPILADDPELAVRIWMFYNRVLLKLAEAFPARCIVARADTIAANPAAWVAALATSSKLPLTTPSSSIHEPALWHGAQASAREGLLFRHYPEVFDLFVELERLAFRPPGTDASVPQAPGWEEPAERQQALRDWHTLSAALIERDRLKKDIQRVLTVLEDGEGAVEDARQGALSAAARLAAPLGTAGWLP